MTKSEFEQLIDKIREKRELRKVSREVVADLLFNYLSKEKIDLPKAAKKDLEIIKKEIRTQLRDYVGRFHKTEKNMNRYLKSNDFDRLICAHSSTRERLEAYPQIVEVIKKINPEIVIDIGCGLNPLAIAKEDMTYYAIDINENDLDIVKKYFNIKQIRGHVISKDIKRIEDIILPRADLCLALKVLDLVEKRGHKIAEKILDKIETRYFLISFSTKTLSGKAMNHPQRGWIERLFLRKGWPFKTIKAKNEIFYLTEKMQ